MLGAKEHLRVLWSVWLDPIVLYVYCVSQPLPSTTVAVSTFTFNFHGCICLLC